jgi:hypothetical protein
MMHVLQDRLSASEIERVEKLPDWVINIMELLAIEAENGKIAISKIVALASEMSEEARS